MMNLNFTPFPALATERLKLRKMELADANEIFILRSDARVNEYIDRQRAGSVEEALEFIKKINRAIEQNESVLWAICQKNDRKLMGTILLWNIAKEDHKAEIGYELLPAWQGKGIMNEALPAIVAYGFETMHLKTIEGHVNAGNHPSIRLVEKNGFRREKTYEYKKDQDDQMVKMVVYSLSKV